MRAMPLSAKQKARYEAMREDLREEYLELQTAISGELAKVKKKI